MYISFSLKFEPLITIRGYEMCEFLIFDSRETKKEYKGGGGASGSMQQGFHNLPRDLFLEIFLRLPVDALTRFKCVCKSWYALINDPKFISMHLNYNRNNNEFVLIKRCLLTCLGKKENILSLVSCRKEFSSVNIAVDLHLCKKQPYLQVLGHCDGIICLSNYRDDLVLCNPAIKESIVLPVSSLLCFASNPNLISQTKALGFGYDLKNQQYKVVRIVSYWEEFGDNLPKLSRVEVYTLGTDSWREINNVKVPAIVQYSPCFEIYFNGAFYWQAMENTNNEVILSFNMGTEEFQVIPMPDFLSNIDHYSICKSLQVWNNCLALVTFPGKGIEKSFQVHVMENYGVKESWTRKLSIGPLIGVEMPLKFWRNGDEILMETIDGQAVSCNIITKEIKNLPVYGIPKSFQALACVNSLVSIKKRIII